ncbi:MAG TPA: hypothetical protein VFH39_03840 [Candidatus Saccharimonadales bacterium]|nr:hypothetical protein [Candidatus Saccharimonadales bacterium]
MSKAVFLVTPDNHPNVVPYQAPDVKNWLNHELARIADYSKRQVVVIVEVAEL